MKYQVIAQHAQEYPVKMMCQTLDVSQSGYYAWCPVSDLVGKSLRES
jgi:hypothetical protein